MEFGKNRVKRKKKWRDVKVKIEKKIMEKEKKGQKNDISGQTNQTKKKGEKKKQKTTKTSILF